MEYRVIGPFVFDGRMDDIQVEVGLVFFKQDGAPTHYSNQVRAARDTNFPARWIGRANPIPRSPDLTLLDLFFYGHIKDVYSEKIRDIINLRERIIAAAGTVTCEMVNT